MFFTRPVIKPLNLDLREFTGGGECPSQFEGRTTDGREIYIRYRGGWLSAAIIEKPEDYRSGNLFEARIGPPYHGAILLEQVCDLLGLTINGARPVLMDRQLRDAAEKSQIIDLSGRTTYWMRNLSAVTEQGWANFDRALKLEFPDLHILKCYFTDDWRNRRYSALDSLASDDWTTLTFGGSDASVKAITDRGHVSIDDLHHAFPHLASAYVRTDTSVFHGSERPKRPYAQWFSERVGRPVEFPGKLMRGFLRADFATDSAEARSFIRAFVGTADLCFSNKYEDVDTQSGELLKTYESDWAWYSADLKHWCASTPDRFVAPMPWGENGDENIFRVWRAA